jgi:hypothetical protein
MTTSQTSSTVQSVICIQFTCVFVSGGLPVFLSDKVRALQVKIRSIKAHYTIGAIPKTAGFDGLGFKQPTTSSTTSPSHLCCQGSANHTSTCWPGLQPIPAPADRDPRKTACKNVALTQWKALNCPRCAPNKHRLQQTKAQQQPQQIFIFHSTYRLPKKQCPDDIMSP